MKEKDLVDVPALCLALAEAKLFWVRGVGCDLEPATIVPFAIELLHEDGDGLGVGSESVGPGSDGGAVLGEDFVGSAGVEVYAEAGGSDFIRTFLAEDVVHGAGGGVQAGEDFVPFVGAVFGEGRGWFGVHVRTR